MKKPLMAFWPYSSALSNTHFCCGVITEFTDEGNVETVEYGRGNFFKPVAILPEKSGRELENKLDALEAKHDKEYRDMRRRHFEEVAAIVKGLLPFNKK